MSVFGHVWVATCIGTILYSLLIFWRIARRK